VQKTLSPTFVGNVIHVLKLVLIMQLMLEVMRILLQWGHSVRVRREEEKGTISWKIKFRNGTEKNFVSPITTKPWGKFIPKLADGDKPNQGEINSQRLYREPEGLNTGGELPVVPKESFKKGVYY
jgi:adenylylsulfate reductase subunit B